MSGASRSEEQTQAGWLVSAGLLALGIVPAESKVQPQQRCLSPALIFVAACAVQPVACSTFNAACVLSDSMQPSHFCFSQAALAE